MRKITVLGVLMLAPQALAAQNGVTDAINSITAADFIRRVGVIAHDSMRGRNTPSPELDKTAEYLAAELKKREADGKGETLGDAIIQAIRTQLAKAGFDAR